MANTTDKYIWSDPNDPSKISTPGVGNARVNPDYVAPSTSPGVNEITGAGEDTGVNRPVVENKDVPGVDSFQDFTAGLQTSEAARRAEAAKQAQIQVDLINKRFEQELQKEAVNQEDRMGQTRSMSARGGLIGSSFGAQKSAKTEAFGKQEVERMTAAKELKVAEVFGRFDELAEKRIANDRELAFLGREEAMAKQKEFIDEARQSITAMGQSGISYNELSEEDKNELKEQTKYDDFMLTAIMENAKPQAEAVEWDKRVIGDTLVWSGIDPSTGQLITMEKRIEAPTNADLGDYEQFIDKNGNLLFVNPTTKEVFTVGDEGQFGEKEKTLTPLEEAQALADIEKTNAEIAKIYTSMNETTDPIQAEKNIIELQNMQDARAEKVKQRDNALIQSGNDVEMLELKMKDLDAIINHPGLNSGVGIIPGGRVGLWDNLSGQKSDFIAAVKQLVSQETMDTLTALKAKGGTLGALSDQERIMLQNAATKIGTWERKNWIGDATDGFATTKALFVKEIEKIKAQHQLVLDEAKRVSEAGGTDTGVGSEAQAGGEYSF